MFTKNQPLYAYTQQHYKLVNHELRRGRKISLYSSKIIEDIIDAINKTEASTEEYTLYRGTFNSFVNSKIYKDPGFMSKTSDIDVAEIFADSYDGEEEPVILAIKYPPGTKQLYLAPLSHHPDEEEFLTFPGEIIRFTGREELLTNKKTYGNYTVETTTTIMHCEYVDSQPDYIVDRNIDSKLEKMFIPLLDFIRDSKMKNFFIRTEEKISTRTIGDKEDDLKEEDLYGFFFIHFTIDEILEVGFFDPKYESNIRDEIRNNKYSPNWIIFVPDNGRMVKKTVSLQTF